MSLIEFSNGSSIAVDDRARGNMRGSGLRFFNWQAPTFADVVVFDLPVDAMLDELHALADLGRTPPRAPDSGRRRR